MSFFNCRSERRSSEHTASNTVPLKSTPRSRMFLPGALTPWVLRTFLYSRL
jgi:hypothetical protein